MKAPTKELLIKVQNEPGLCSKTEIREVYDWLSFLNDHLNLYKSVCGEPTGFTISAKLNDLVYYLKKSVDI